MKRNLLYSLMLIFSISMFTSCGNDDDETQDQPIVGTWNVDPVKYGEDQMFVSGPVHMKWEAPENTMLGFLYLSSIPTLAEGLAGPMLSQVLQNVTFQADGNIVASYSNAGVDMENPVTPVWEKSELGFATYKVVSDSKILLFLNLEKILKSTRALSAADFAPIASYLQNGIPVNYTISNDNRLLVYLDKEFMNSLTPILVGIADLIPEDDFESLGGMGPMLKAILGSLSDVMPVTTNFEFGLKFSK